MVSEWGSAQMRIGMVADFGSERSSGTSSVVHTHGNLARLSSHPTNDLNLGSVEGGAVVVDAAAALVEAAGVVAGVSVVVVGGRALVLLHAAMRRNAASAARGVMCVVMIVYTLELRPALQRVPSRAEPG